jgi:hypothetical protein
MPARVLPIASFVRCHGTLHGTSHLDSRGVANWRVYKPCDIPKRLSVSVTLCHGIKRSAQDPPTPTHMPGACAGAMGAHVRNIVRALRLRFCWHGNWGARKIDSAAGIVGVGLPHSGPLTCCQVFGLVSTALAAEALLREPRTAQAEVRSTGTN